LIFDFTDSWPIRSTRFPRPFTEHTIRCDFQLFVLSALPFDQAFREFFTVEKAYASLFSNLQQIYLYEFADFPYVDSAVAYWIKWGILSKSIICSFPTIPFF